MRWNPVRAGLARGWIEFRQAYSTPGEVIPGTIVGAVMVAVMVWTRHTTVPGTAFSLGSAMLPGTIGMSVGLNGIVTLGALLAAEREDGTLLRAKAVPGGMTGYLIGKVVAISSSVLAGVTVTLIAAPLLLSGLSLARVSTWLTLAWVLVLGLLASLPLGAVLGSLFPSARSAGLLMLFMGVIVAVSGIFYPITHLPAWMQPVGQVFPLYWLGLGMRSALLPNSMAAVEIGGSWRHLLTFGVLTGWAIAGLLVAPVVLRRMARRESGASLMTRRELAMRRI